MRMFRTGAGMTVVADAARVGSDAGSIRHERALHAGTLIDVPVLIALVALMFSSCSMCSYSSAAEPVVVRLTTDGHLKQRPCWSPDEIGRAHV